MALQKPPRNSQPDLDGDRELAWNDDEAVGVERYMVLGIIGMLSCGSKLLRRGAVLT